MNEFVQRLQREAERIAAKHPYPAFYAQFQAHSALARRIYFHHPLAMLIRREIQPLLQEDLGHGLHHSARVSIDGATLICIELEANPISQKRLERLMLLGLIAGLLHDICRGQEHHAEAGAHKAAKVLRAYPLEPEEIDCICTAIRNHEAFVTTIPCSRPSFQLVSDCLYDADKFRWGPDTFTHTLWHMVDHQKLTPQELIDRFPWGISGIVRIVDTFRTSTGRQFGPEIIETGIEIGKEIYRYLLQNYGENHDAK